MKIGERAVARNVRTSGGRVIDWHGKIVAIDPHGFAMLEDDFFNRRYFHKALLEAE